MQLRSILFLLCCLASARLPTVAQAAGAAFGGGGGNASAFPALGGSVTCKISALDEKLRTLTVVRWVRVNNPQAPGVIPEEVAAYIKQFLASAREIRANARTLQEFAVANSYQDTARRLQYIREQEFNVIVPLGAKISKQTRSGISALALNDHVSVTGIGSNFTSVGGRSEPGAILATTDLVEMSGEVSRAAVPPIPGASAKEPPGKSAPANARMVLTRTGRIASRTPLSLQSDGGAVIALLIDTAADVGYIHFAELNLRDLKAGDWIEVTGQLTAPGALSAQGIRVTTQTPLSLNGLASPSITNTPR